MKIKHKLAMALKDDFVNWFAVCVCSLGTVPALFFILGFVTSPWGIKENGWREWLEGQIVLLVSIIVPWIILFIIAGSIWLWINSGV